MPSDVDSIPLTTTELLSWVKYELSVAPHATPPDPPLILFDPGILFAPLLPLLPDSAPGRLARSRYRPHPPIVIDPGLALLPAFIREPTATETAIEAPWRLIISPSRLGGWAHATQPVTHDGLTELWHTRLGIRGEQQDAPGTFLVNESARYYRTIRAIWTPGFDVNTAPAFPDAFQHAVDPNERWQLVRLMSDFFITDLTPQPAQVEAPHPLAAGRLDGRTRCLEVGGARQTEGLNVLEWRHIISQGRDQYVRIVKAGHLVPTRHPAVRIDIYERKFQRFSTSSFQIGGGDSVAYIRKRTFVVVRDPEPDLPRHRPARRRRPVALHPRPHHHHDHARPR